MSVKETLKQLESEKTKVLMAELYGAEKAEENRARYRYVAEHFEKHMGNAISSCLLPQDGRRSAATTPITIMARCWRAASTWTASGGGTERNRHDPHFK